MAMEIASSAGAWARHHDHASEADDGRHPAPPVDMLAQEQNGEDDDEQRPDEIDRGDVGHVQMRQRVVHHHLRQRADRCARRMHRRPPGGKTAQARRHQHRHQERQPQHVAHTRDLEHVEPFAREILGQPVGAGEQRAAEEHPDRAAGVRTDAEPGGLHARQACGHGAGSRAALRARVSRRAM
jgi:hypothetical protein